jgi:hypothetical protein
MKTEHERAVGQSNVVLSAMPALLTNGMRAKDQLEACQVSNPTPSVNGLPHVRQHLRPQPKGTAQQ